MKAEFAHHCRDGLIWCLERLEQTHRVAAQARDVLQAETGADATTIRIDIPVDEIVNAVDGPVTDG